MSRAIRRLDLRSRALAGGLPSQAVDRICAEVAGDFDRRGIPLIVLKGASFATRLYDEPWERPYKDCDVLVPPAAVGAAERALAELGFSKSPLGAARGDAQAWARSRDEAIVDLHHTLQGVGASPSEPWRVLWRHSASLEIGGRDVRVLDDAGLAFHAAVHAAAHGGRWSRPLEDLGRAVAIFSPGVWAEATQIATALSAVGAFAAGLRLSAAGRDLATQLALPYAANPEVLIRASGPDGPLALGLESLARTRGLRAKARLIRIKLFPSRDFMRAWVRYRGRPEMGLPLAYLWRPVWLLARLPSSYRKWRKARSLAAASKEPSE
ncbi:MAG TPA: nucleotidyltransferase family protein [Actinomycetota bacterium]